MIYKHEFHLSSLISEMIKVFRKNHYKDLEEKLKKIQMITISFRFRKKWQEGISY